MRPTATSSWSSAGTKRPPTRRSRSSSRLVLRAKRDDVAFSTLRFDERHESEKGLDISLDHDAAFADLGFDVDRRIAVEDAAEQILGAAQSEADRILSRALVNASPRAGGHHGPCGDLRQIDQE